jgi:membrane protease YdiL (CAAX protease family)
MAKQLLIFFLLAYLISWIIWFPLYAPILGFGPFRALPYQHAIGAFGPAIAAILCTFLFNGKEGIRKLFFQPFRRKNLLYLVMALSGPFLLLLIAILLHYFQTDKLQDISLAGLTKEFPQFNIFVFFIYNLIFFGFGEETGWRGFALPRLQNRYNALSSGIILTLFWAAWHWPLFLYRPGYLSMDLASATGWLLSLLTGSVLLTWLFNSSGGSILLCAIFHSTVDVAFTSDYLTKELTGLMGILITLWGVVIILVYKPKDLSSEVRIRA